MFNIKLILSTILASFTSALKGIAVNNLPAIESTIAAYITTAEVRLQSLAENAIKGEANDGISKEFLVDRLEDEADILKAELLSLATIGEGIAQAIVNEVVDILFGVIEGLKIAQSN